MTRTYTPTDTVDDFGFDQIIDDVKDSDPFISMAIATICNTREELYVEELRELEDAAGDMTVAQLTTAYRTLVSNRYQSDTAWVAEGLAGNACF